MRELSRRSGVDVTSISRIELGQRAASRRDSVDTLVSLAQALGQPPQDYLTLAGHVLPPAVKTFQQIVMELPELTTTQKLSLIAVYEEFTRGRAGVLAAGKRDELD